jgi:16S rRNA (guanine527-N7)-methyltransferase
MRLALTTTQAASLVAYTDLLLAANRHINLTGIKTREGIERALILDSLSIAPTLSTELTVPSLRPCRVIDIGSGAGIPGIPLKVIFDHWQVALVESIGKKARFLEQVVSRLSLSDVQVMGERAETLGHGPEWRDRADLCLARAVAPLATLLELCAPLVSPGGWLVFPKSGRLSEELRAAGPAERVLHVCGQLQPVPEEFGLGADRYLYIGQKSSFTPAGFPRRIGLARLRPIAQSK